MEPIGLPQRSELRALPISQLRDQSLTDFCLFIEVGGLMVLYAPSLYQWRFEELGRLQSEGHHTLYFHETDAAKVSAYCDLANVSIIREDLAPAPRINQITDVAAEFTRVLFNHELNEAALFRGQQIAEALVKCIEEDRTCIKALGQLASHDHYTYYHSGRVAAYATAIALHLGLHDSYCLTQLSLGCLLHDIGKSQIDLKLLNKPGALSPSERSILQQHPKLGVELVERAILTAVPKDIISHHHERLDGTGYPYGLTGRQLLEEVKIAAFADVFDALTTNRPYQKSRSRYEALDFIRHRLLHNLHHDSYKALVEILHESGQIAS